MNVLRGGRPAIELRDVAHELSNELAVIMARAAVIADDSEGSEARGDVDELIAAAERAAELSRSLMEIGGGSSVRG